MHEKQTKGQNTEGNQNQHHRILSQLAVLKQQLPKMVRIDVMDMNANGESNLVHLRRMMDEGYALIHADSSAYYFAPPDYFLLWEAARPRLDELERQLTERGGSK